MWLCWTFGKRLLKFGVYPHAYNNGEELRPYPLHVVGVLSTNVQDIGSFSQCEHYGVSTEG